MKKRIIFIFALCVLLTCSCTNQKNDENTEISSESVFSIQDSEKETENETKSEDINSGKNSVEDIDSALQIEHQKNLNNEEDVSDQIKISLANSSIEATSLENTIIIVTNDSMYDITVGDEYWISKLNGEQWEDMPANIVWNDLGIQIRAGSYHEFNCNLNLFGNFDEDEKYRITKKVYVNQKEYTLYADFTVN